MSYLRALKEDFFDLVLRKLTLTVCSTAVLSKRIVLITNASEKDVFFKATFSLVRLLTFGLFQNRLLDPSGLCIKGGR